MIGCGSSPTRRSVGQISKFGPQILFWRVGVSIPINAHGFADRSGQVPVAMPTCRSLSRIGTSHRWRLRVKPDRGALGVLAGICKVCAIVQRDTCESSGVKAITKPTGRCAKPEAGPVSADRRWGRPAVEARSRPNRAASENCGSSSGLRCRLTAPARCCHKVPSGPFLSVLANRSAGTVHTLHLTFGNISECFCCSGRQIERGPTLGRAND